MSLTHNHPIIKKEKIFIHWKNILMLVFFLKIFFIPNSSVASPFPVEPENNAVISSNSVSLEWVYCGSSSYAWQITTLSGALVKLGATNNQNTVAVITDLPSGEYRWRVGGADGPSDCQLWSSDTYGWMNFTIKNSPPVAIIESAPQNTSDTSFEYEISISGIGVSYYNFKIDNQPWLLPDDVKPVDTPASFSITEEGEHTFYVIGKDDADDWQLESNATSVKWIVDSTGPSVALSSSKDGSSVEELWIIKGTASDLLSDVSKVELQITLQKNDESWYWSKDDGQFILAETWLNASGLEDWSLTSNGVGWSEGTLYKIIVRATDTLGNINKKDVSFVFGIQKQSSTISCELSEETIVLGAPLHISGYIIPKPSNAGEYVEIIFIPPGEEIDDSKKRHTFADSNGEFSYNLECGVISSSGTWKIATYWTGDEGLDAANSPDQSIEVSKAENRLTLNVTSQAIKLGEAVSISGKLTPQPDCGGGLSGIPVTLFITGPGNIPDVKAVTTNDQWGHFILQDYEGFDQLGDWTVTASFAGNDGYLATNTESIQVRVVETAGYAVIVQGKIFNEEGLASHNKTTRFVYNMLKGRGLLDDDIIYFNYDTDQTGVDALPSRTSIEHAITVWARDKIDPVFVNPDPNSEVNGKPANFYIIFIDHGLEDEFYIYPEVITSTDLGGWINNLQNKLTEQALEQEIITILGFCHSGSFISKLSGNNRVIITSSATNEVSYKGPKELDDQGIVLRDGEYFITEFFKGASLGKSIKQCFNNAVSLTEKFTASNSGSVNSGTGPYFDKALQHPLLDDNGDNIGGNDLSDLNGDGALSDKLFIGVSAVTGNAPGDVSIQRISETVFLDANTSTTDFWATVNDDNRLSTIWAEVKTPNYSLISQGSTGQVELDLPKTIGIYNDVTQRYEWANLGGFVDPGIYQVFYFAKDDITGNISSLVETKVYKKKDLSANTQPNYFNLLKPDNTAEVLTTVKLDWEGTIDPEGHSLTYTVLVSKDDNTFSDPIRIEDLTRSAYLVSSSHGIEDLSKYYWKVLAIDEYGAVRVAPEIGSWVFTTNNTNANFPGWIKGRVYDASTGVPLLNGVIDFEIDNIKSEWGGYYLGIIPAGTYKITASTNGYLSKSYLNVYIPSDGFVTKDFGLDPAFSIVNGDLNKDGSVDLDDSQAGLKVLTLLPNSADVFEDVNNDGKIGLKDSIYIIQKNQNDE